MDKKERKALAVKAAAKAIKYRDAAIKRFSKDTMARDMELMFRDDCRKTLRVYDLFAAGLYKEAYEVGAGMDTAARDGIDLRIWKEILK